MDMVLTLDVGLSHGLVNEVIALVASRSRVELL